MKKEGSTLPYVIFVFSLAIILAVIILLPSKFKTKNQTTIKISPTATPVFTPTQLTCKPRPAQKSKGDTYINKELGFSVKPPVNWNVSVECREADLAIVLVEAPETGKEPPGCEEEIIPHCIRRKFEVNVDQRGRTLPIKELEKEIRQDPFFNSSVTTVQNIKINNRDALRVGEWSLGGITNIYVPYDQKVYSIYHLEFVEASSVDNPKYTKEFEEFVASFRFLD